MFGDLTNVLIEATGVLKVQIRQRSVYMRAYFLPSLCGTECSYDRHLRRSFTQLLRRSVSSSQRWIKICLRCLVVVDAVEAEAESVHDDIGLWAVCCGWKSKEIITHSIQKEVS